MRTLAVVPLQHVIVLAALAFCAPCPCPGRCHCCLKPSAFVSARTILWGVRALSPKCHGKAQRHLSSLPKWSEPR
eukprot:9277298-Pyramimonas_sp.AAC.1